MMYVLARIQGTGHATQGNFKFIILMLHTTSYIFIVKRKSNAAIIKFQNILVLNVQIKVEQALVHAQMDLVYAVHVRF